MGRILGSGKQTCSVTFRTSMARYNAMMKIGKELGFKRGTKSKVYRTAERLLIRKQQQRAKDETE